MGLTGTSMSWSIIVGFGGKDIRRNGGSPFAALLSRICSLLSGRRAKAAGPCAVAEEFNA